MADTPATLTYASVFSRDSVCIDLNISDLNGINILSCDIQNAYLNADFQENIWTRAGLEFGSEAGTIMIFRKAFYGLKSSGAIFCVRFAKTLNYIGFLSTKAYYDVWYWPAVKPNDFEYYEYILCYVDNILCISHDPGISVG